MKRRFVSVVLVAAQAGCWAAPEQSQTDGRGVDTESGFRLTIAVERPELTVTDEILVEATFGHDQPNAVEIHGSGSGIVGFSVTRLEDGLGTGGPVTHMDCVTYHIPAGPPARYPFTKSGGWGENDPNAAFMELFFADPQLHLPAGTWRIDAVAEFSIGSDCTAHPTSLRASVEVTVTD